MGVGVAVGAQTGVYVYAEASVGSSKSNADSTTWQNTTLTGQNISLKAEGDTTLRGATAIAALAGSTACAPGTAGTKLMPAT